MAPSWISEASALETPGEILSRTEVALSPGTFQVPQALLEQSNIRTGHSAPGRSSIPSLLHSTVHLSRGPGPD